MNKMVVDGLIVVMNLAGERFQQCELPPQEYGSWFGKHQDLSFDTEEYVQTRSAMETLKGDTIFFSNDTSCGLA